MEMVQISSLRDHLKIRKEKLNYAVKSVPDHSKIVDLIRQVDSALEKIEFGTYGICEVCHDHVEEDRLLIDPLISVCLGCLNEAQQKALENDLEFAAKIQRNLLPKNNLKIDGWDFSYHYNPAGAVSGDFTDLISLNDDSVIFTIGDVSGKGISASMMMSHLHGLIHSLLSFGFPVNEIVDKANKLFCESTLFSSYATMVMGKANTDGTVEITVAGHNPPLITKNGHVDSISATGMPVGLFCESEYTLKKFHLDKGDSILLYTDGLTEAYVNNVEYGEEKIKLLMQSFSNGLSTASQMVNEIVNNHKAWLGETKAQDDVTLLVLKRN